MKRLLITILLSSGIAGLSARSVSLNDGWQFRLSPSAEWEAVDLPHTWNEDSYLTKNYRKGKSLYRREIILDPSDSSRRHYLRLEGASKSVKVTVNGHDAGSHEGGYTEAVFNLSPFLSFPGPNIIEIEADNNRPDIPPVSGDFTFFGGIYRDVWLEDYSPLHFSLSPFAYPGIKVTPTLENGTGSISVEMSLTNEESAERQGVARINIYAPDGSLIESADKKFKVAGNSRIALSHKSEDIGNPRLWSPDSPQLYRVETLILDKKGNELDRRIADTGLRTFRFDTDGQFYLNGKPMKLRGICRHQDMKPVGVALSDETHRRDMLLAKDMGANFIRISHYPQDPAILEMADRLGLLVWEEIPVIDIVPDDPAYAQNAETNLREMITGHYNHPSVIMWGYMNEILLKAPGDNTPQGRATVERTRELVNRLEAVCREMDPTRLTTMAFHGSDRYCTTGLSDIIDINGWNLYQGWYGGDLTGFEKFLSDRHRENPSKPIIVSEYGAGSDRRLHSLSPEPFDFSIEYQQKYLEHYLPVIEDSVFVAGASHWNLIDFGSAQREESMPGINNKGLLYADRTPKDVYHYFKSAWRDDADHVHIASRDWEKRTVVSDNLLQAVTPVKIYANTPGVSLSVNGESFGDSIVRNHTAVFNVPLKPGANTLVAKGEDATDVFTIDMAIIPSHIDTDNVRGLELAVNVGSNCSYTSPLSGLTWIADREYTPGGWGRLGGERKNVTVKMAGTHDLPLYQSLVENTDGYRFDVPDGDYELELGFADPSGNSEKIAYLLDKDDSSSSADKNVFSICINGERIEPAFSTSYPNGMRNVIIKKYHVRAKDGSLILNLKPVNGKTILNAIKLRQI